MAAVDTVILDATEWLCRRFQWLTGRTNVWLAIQLTNVSIVIYFVWAAEYFRTRDAVTRTFVGVFCLGVLYALTQTVFRTSIETAETFTYRRVAAGFRNPRRERDAQLRIAFLTLVVVLWPPIAFVYVTLHRSIVVLSYLLIVLTTMVLYVLASDPLPPCAGKLKEWLRGLAGSRTDRVPVHECRRSVRL